MRVTLVFGLVLAMFGWGAPVLDSTGGPAVLVVYAAENTQMTGRPFTLEDDALTPIPGVASVAPPDPAYGLRDPSLARFGGFYWLVATKPRRAAYLGTGATALQVHRSRNLADWTPLPDIPTGVPGATRAWAPELLVDGADLYVYYAVTTDTTEDAAAVGTFEIYARRAASSGLSRWDPPVRMLGLVEPKVIDPQVTKLDDGRYVMFYKDETALRICRAWASSPLGPWSTDRTGDWLGASPAEGPQLVRQPGGGWRLYYDRYTANRLVYRDSADLDTWGPEVPLTYSPAALRHPGYLWITADEWASLVSRPRAVRAYTVAAFPVPSGRPTPIPLGTAQGDTELWSPLAPTRLVAAEPGWYSLHFTLRWAINPTGQRSAAYRFSAGPMQYMDSRAATGGGMGTEHGGSDSHFWLGAGEYVEVMGLQTSGAPLGVLAVVSFAREGG